MTARSRIALIADTFPPHRTSGAVQLRDLSREFVRQGHALTVILPSPEQAESWRLDSVDGVHILRLKAPKTKDLNYVRRTIGEWLMPFAMRRNLRKSPLANENWTGIIWYAPSIFHGPLASSLKNASNCKGYLIIRDIFPEWAVDMGLMRRGLPYFFFRSVARYQYSVADIIGVQTSGNLSYFKDWESKSGRTLEILSNWLDAPARVRCPIRVSETTLAGRKLFVYAGNMGVAQGMGIILDLAEALSTREDVGFIFVGRGSDLSRLRNIAREKKLNNVLFFEEIHPDEIPDLYSQCDVGIVTLDFRHKSHNIPGKFLTYMQSGLPVIANINSGNDLANMIRDARLGQVCDSNDIAELKAKAEKILVQVDTDLELKTRCQQFFLREFSVEKAVRQIVSALSG